MEQQEEQLKEKPQKLGTVEFSPMTAPTPRQEPDLSKRIDKLQDDVNYLKVQNEEIIKLLSSMVTTRESEVTVFEETIKVVKENQNYLQRAEARVKETLDIVHKNTLALTKNSAATSANSKAIKNLNMATVNQGEVNSNLQDEIEATKNEIRKVNKNAEHFKVTVEEYQKETDKKIDEVAECKTVLDKIFAAFGKKHV